MKTRAVRLTALVLGVLVIAGVVIATNSTAFDPVRSTPCGKLRASNEAKAQLHVVGTQLKDTDGNVFMPYGISVVSGPQTPNWALMEGAARAQIIASQRYWHSNAVRLQISETLLFKNPTPKYHYNVPFAKSVDRLVCRIIAQGQVPVINDTTIFTGRERGPGERTVRFWRFMAKRYGNRFPVIFDLFNEPQVIRSPRTSRYLPRTKVWSIWRSGGRVGGIRYVGMQDLVDEIRVRQHVDNVIWIEEPYYVTADRASLGLLPLHLLRGDDIVYAFHKPSMSPDSSSFKDLETVVGDKLPLIDSEWGQFAATDRPWMCQPDSYKLAPRYLQFLRDSGIGMLAWSLQPGALVQGTPGKDTVNDGADLRFTSDPAQLAVPNEMTKDYGCTAAARGQGAGRLVMDYFERYSKPAPAGLFPKLGR